MGRSRNIERIFNKFDRSGNGLVTAEDLVATLSSVGVAASLQDTVLVLQMLDSRGAGGRGVNILEFAKLRDLFNGHLHRYERPEEDSQSHADPPLQHSTAAATDVLKLGPDGHRVQQEDDMAGMDETLMNSDSAANIRGWRKSLGGFLESSCWERFMLAVLLADIVRFFIDLLILEELFGEVEGSPELEDATDVLHIISISILGFFTLEIGLLLVALGPLYFRWVECCGVLSVRWCVINSAGAVLLMIALPPLYQAYRLLVRPANRASVAGPGAVRQRHWRLPRHLQVGGKAGSGARLVSVYVSPTGNMTFTHACLSSPHAARLWRVVRVLKKTSDRNASAAVEKIRHLERAVGVAQQNFTRASDVCEFKTQQISHRYGTGHVVGFQSASSFHRESTAESRGFCLFHSKGILPPPFSLAGLLSLRR